MKVEPDKLENIAWAISQQADLLRRAGRISRADEMERRASELRGFVAAGRMAASGRHDGVLDHAA